MTERKKAQDERKRAEYERKKAEAERERAEAAEAGQAAERKKAEAERRRAEAALEEVVSLSFTCENQHHNSNLLLFRLLCVTSWRVRRSSDRF